MGQNLTVLYTKFYRFPVFAYQLDASVVALVLLISVAAALLGTISAVRRAVKLPPAEAMRPEPPGDFRPTIVERSGLGFMLPQTGRMILRQLERRPIKAMMTCLGIATAAAVLVLGSFGKDALDYIMDFQFNLSQRQDIQINFVGRSGIPGQDSNQVVIDLHKAAVDVVGLRFRTDFGPQFAKAESTDCCGVPGQDSEFTVKQRDHDRIDVLFQQRLFGSNNRKSHLRHQQLPLGRHLFGLFFCLLDYPDIHERVLRQVIPFSVA